MALVAFVTPWRGAFDSFAAFRFGYTQGGIDLRLASLFGHLGKKTNKWESCPLPMGDPSEKVAWVPQKRTFPIIPTVTRVCVWPCTFFPSTPWIVIRVLKCCQKLGLTSRFPFVNLDLRLSPNVGPWLCKAKGPISGGSPSFPLP